MCHRLIGSLIFCLLSATIFAAKFSAKVSHLHINESATRFLLQKGGATVSLALENPLTVAMTARVTLELVDPRDNRVIFYLWPPAGGVKFDFRFRTRYGIKAKTAPSVLYDYYNPEAQAVVAPAQFVVR
jgi:A-macroglobulin receptor binding domain